MNKDEIISSGLLELYALGIASAEERLTVEECLSQYPEIKDELRDIEISLEDYAQANGVQPSAQLKQKIFSSIDSNKEPNVQKIEEQSISKPVEKIYRIPAFYKMLAAASVVLLIGSIVVAIAFYNKYNSSQDELQIAQQKLEQQDKYNQAMASDINVMTDKNARPVVLNGTAMAPEALAKIFWMKNNGQVYIDPSNLPQVPEGKQYQLWAIVDGKPVDAGMITTEKGIYHIQKMKSFGKVEAFAITLEKKGGSPTPTLDQMIVHAAM